jgi:murein DD-endopeptidase MepM/ murein hydrolase activator NlpD
MVGIVLASVVILIYIGKPPVSSQATPTPSTDSTAQAELVVVQPSATPSSTPTSPLASPVRVATPTAAPTPLPTESGMSDPFFDPQRFSYAPDFHDEEIQRFLDRQPGPLKDVTFQIGDRSQSFAEVLTGFSSLYSINPKILLALLEQRSQLLSTAEPSEEQFAWAMGNRNEAGRLRGLYSQLRWAVFELRHALRDYGIGWQAEALPALQFADASSEAAAEDEATPEPPDPLSPNIGLTRYALSRVLAPGTTPDNLPVELNTFLATYTRLFGDPRVQPDWPDPSEPFLTSPMDQPFRVTSFFDHDTPFLHQNGSLTSFWGTSEAALSYDGHTGWDYAMMPPDRVLAAAGGVVVFAGNSDDGCYTPARGVIIDHGNGYRTLYWHLHTIAVEAGQIVERGEQVGVAGETGCSFGPHLHLQVQYLGRDIDPYGWCGKVADPWAINPTGQPSTWLWADMINPCGTPPPDTIVVDNQSPGFITSGEWTPIAPGGYAGSALYTSTRWNANARQPWQVRPLVSDPALAIWQPELPRAGTYRVLAYIPYILNGLDDSQELRYMVRHDAGTTKVVVNGEEHANFWADLGTYTFDPANPRTSPQVVVSTLAGDEARGLWADAVAWVPVEAPPAATSE